MATLLRNKHYQKFTVVPNGYLMDTTLSLQAIGLLTKLYQLPNSWDINIKSLQTQFKNGRDAIAKALKELEKKGYIKRYQEKLADGTFGNNIIELCGEGSIKPFSPCTENPYTEKPSTEKPPHTNTINTNTIDIEEEEEERARENKISNESVDDKKEKFDPQTFMVEFVKEKVKDEKQQNYLIELLSYKIIDLKTKTKSATATYILKAIKQHGTEFSEKTEVQPRKKSKTAYKANKTRLETMPEWDNEPEQRTEEEEAAQLAHINELMKDLK